jgi:hypothetical protein
MSDSLKGRTPKKLVFLPHRYSDRGMQMVVDRVELDGKLKSDLIEASPQLIKLEDFDGWTNATVRGEIEVPKRVLENVIPPHEQEEAPIGLLLAVRCKSTFLRRPHWISRSSSSLDDFASTHTFELSLKREELRDKVNLVPLVVRTAAARQTTLGYATAYGARLAEAREWTVRIDRHEAPAGDNLDVRYEDFDADDDIPASGKALHALQCDLESPILWINSAHVDITSVLDSRATRGPKARMREVFFDQIAQMTWFELFAKALGDLSPDCNVQWDWQRSVLEYMGRRVYPDMDKTARLETLASDAQEPERIAELLVQASLHLQKDQKVVNNMQKLIGELEKGGGDD